LNKTGAGAMGFTLTNKNASAPGGYPSAGVIQFTGTATGSIIVDGQGQTSDDGFSGCRAPGPGKVGRWGKKSEGRNRGGKGQRGPAVRIPSAPATSQCEPLRSS